MGEIEATAVIENSSLTLAEEGGASIELTGRALPYLPVSIGGKQRAEFTWYPGSPQATVQMLGPEEDAITLNGFWKDRFVAGTGAASIQNTGVNNIQQLIQALDNMRRMGRQVTLSWGPIRRIGHVTGFTQTWHNIHDCEWELEFSVISHEDLAVPTVLPEGTNLTDFSVQAALAGGFIGAARFGRYAIVADSGIDVFGARAVSAVTPATPADLAAEAAFGARDVTRFGIARPTELNQLDQFLAALENIEDQAIVLSNAVAGYARQATALITLPGNVTRDVISTVSGFVSRIALAIGTTVDAALTDGYALANIGGQDEAPFGLQLQASSYNRDFRNAMRSSMYLCAVTRYELTNQLREELVDTFIAPNDMDLRDVSTRFYGTPDSWRELMLYNGLNSSRLNAGQQIYVPRQAASSGPGLTSGGSF